MRQISSSSLDAKVNRASGPPALNEQHVPVLRESVAEHPRYRRWMQSRRCCTGAAPSTGAVPSECAAWRCTERWLPQESCESSRPRRASAAQPAASTQHYGYTAAHRCAQCDGRRYSYCLTDAERALIADPFQRPTGGRGMPARLECCELVDAFWRLPKSFPHWFTVYRSFSRWAAKGAFEACETVCASSGAGGWMACAT